MIRRIWTMLALLLALAVVPVTILQMRMERESLELVFELTAKLPVDSSLAAFMQLLKALGSKDLAAAESYRRQFREAVAAKQALEEFHSLKDGLIHDIQGQALRNAALVLSLSLLLSVAVSSRIVGGFKRLLRERQEASEKLDKLASLESWQNVARMLVHELRTPITPIKLIATDIESKFTQMDSADFGLYLQQSQALVRRQIGSIEAMVQSFTRFAKLPPVAAEPSLVVPFLQSFKDWYTEEFAGRATLQCDHSLPVNYQGSFDPKLIRDILYNLTKNAAEANPGKPILVRIVALRRQQVLILRVTNSGASIPAETASALFQPYAFGKSGTDGAFNMGLGLSICRKIALDHGGDLALVENDHAHGVCFELSLPQQRQEA